MGANSSTPSSPVQTPATKAPPTTPANVQANSNSETKEWLGTSPFPAADGQIDAPLEELEITGSPTLNRLDKAERREARRRYWKGKRCWILGGLLLVLVAVAVALGVVFGTGANGNNGGSSSGGVNVPDDFAGPPDDFAGPATATTTSTTTADAFPGGSDAGEDGTTTTTATTDSK